MKNLLFIILLSQLLISCSKKKFVIHTTEHIKDTNGFDILIHQFANNIENIWGNNEVVIAGPKDFVKYTDHYKTRSHINFNNGKIIIETISNVKQIEYLQRAIIRILLMSDDAQSVNLYTNNINFTINKKPFLYEQILDHTNHPIRWKWRALQFARYLTKNKIKQRKSGKKTIWSINIQLVKNHLNKRIINYLPHIQKASQKYGVDKSLILAIIQIESNFNPYAISSAEALGLMQILPNAAGKDVYLAQGKIGIPNRNYLLDPINNIELGTAYLALLQNNYLSNIKDSKSKRYATIIAYNGGIGTVLRLFHNNKKKASEIINHMTSQDVYTALITKHPAIQSRNYLIKVNKILNNTIYK
uniref:peptidoglycan lytic exotransglycosylase n=1 Tax=Candidatus Aschnera chinzeii TaxID=1485666 RepID=A0AAT9G3P6_9ENTR|nr:MAG: membrane-bound lytic murein transglycosylase MltC [Candidatus Aschnera chinzeii]